MHEATHVLAADQRDVFAEFLTEQLEQAAAMSGFLFAHSVKDFGGRRKVLAQAFGVLGVNALVFLFERNSQSQDLTFRKAVEVAHGSMISSSQARFSSAQAEQKPRHTGRQKQRRGYRDGAA